MKNILILGAEVRDRFTGNRGAEQLLRTVAGRLRSMGHQPTVTYGRVDPALVLELGLKQYVGNPRTVRLDRWTPVVDKRGFVSIGALGGVLDASGYALGDAWGSETAQWIARKYQQWLSMNIPIVALPQAYGGFVDQGLRATASEAINACTLIFPRDKESHKHVHDLAPNAFIGPVTPDITIAEDVVSAGQSKHDRLVIVPNWNLLRGASTNAYLETLVAVARHSRARNLEPVGLLHEGRKDLEVLKRLAQREKIKIEASKTGWDAKVYIASSRLVVSGRYHAVIAALSTGTPVLTHSWSHKYLEALEVFGVESWMHNPEHHTDVAQRIDELLQFKDSNGLTKAKRMAVSSIEAMWDDVEGVLR